MTTSTAQNISTLTKSTSSTSADNAYGRSVVTDAANNIYVTGSFVGSVSFGTTTLTSAGGADIFIAKYDNTGAFQWARRAGGTSDESSNGIVLSGSDIYIAGQIGATIANFNTPSATGSNEITSVGGLDIFVAKFNNSGTFQWAKRAGGTSDDMANGIAVSGTEVYIVGRIGANFNTPSATGSNEITSVGNADIYIAKYNDAGTLQWVKRGGGTGSDQGFGATATNTNVFITGSFGGTANFNTPSASGSNELSTVSTNYDMFLVSYSAVVLPVEFLNFEGQSMEVGNLLTWTTANEQNNKGFQVERRQVTGDRWAVLGFKTAPSTQGKAGTYDFIDNTPLSMSYYRLRQLDNDGKETLSKVISVERKGENKLKVYPNPVSNVLTVENTEGGNFHILNLLGQEVLNGKAATQRIDVSALRQGTYFLKVGTEQAKFVKQ